MPCHESRQLIDLITACSRVFLLVSKSQSAIGVIVKPLRSATSRHEYGGVGVSARYATAAALGGVRSQKARRNSGLSNMQARGRPGAGASQFAEAWSGT